MRYVAIIRDSGEGRILTVKDGDLRRTVEHERRLGSEIVGEFSDLHVAERALRQACAGWKEHRITRDIA